jgi:hypothetical protein
MPQQLQGYRPTLSDILNTPQAAEIMDRPSTEATGIVDNWKLYPNTTDLFEGFVEQRSLPLTPGEAVTNWSAIGPNTGGQYAYPPRMSIIAARFNEILQKHQDLLIGAP